jgi:hypothetical protein
LAADGWQAVPVAFPSHQGLLAPLWRLWPDRFSILPLWIGALVPDVIDGTENIVFRGEFRQWIGHSLLGASLLGVPVTLVLTQALRRAIRWAGLRRTSSAPGRWTKQLALWLASQDNAGRAQPRGQRLRREAISAWIGAISHVIADMLTHEHSRLLWPFATDPYWLGRWWSSAWVHVSAPGYPDYPIGPHFVGWLVLSVAGAVMFFRWPPHHPAAR